MVFEMVITEVMNRVLGDFIENLDKKQLNIGIWGGELKKKHTHTKQLLKKENCVIVVRPHGHVFVVRVRPPLMCGATQPPYDDDDETRARVH